VTPIDPANVGLPDARCVLKVRREWKEAAKPGEVHEHIRYFITSVEADRDLYLGNAVRGYWSIENRNHHKRDDRVRQEDRHRHRRINVAQNLALTRNALLAIIPFDEKHNLPSLIEGYQDDKAIPMTPQAKRPGPDDQVQTFRLNTLAASDLFPGTLFKTMQTELTKRQQEIVEYLRKSQRQTGIMPSTREIQHYFRFASQTAAMSHLRALERKGVIQRLPGKARAVVFPEDLDRGEIADIPIYGNIAAGMSQDAEPERQGCISVDISALGIPRRARTFALKVRGDSMIDAHICDGDTVILEFREPRKGDIVAALIDGETTLKRYVVEKGQPFLRAENPDYPDLIPARELVIQGVLVALLRHAA
jgi:repressor LexA